MNIICDDFKPLTETEPLFKICQLLFFVGERMGVMLGARSRVSVRKEIRNWQEENEILGSYMSFYLPLHLILTVLSLVLPFAIVKYTKAKRKQIFFLLC